MFRFLLYAAVTAPHPTGTGFVDCDQSPSPGDAMNPLRTLNPTLPAMVPVAVPVAVLVPTPMVARRVQSQPQAAKPAEAKPPTTLETVAKVVDGVNQLVGFAKKFFDKPAGKPVAARAAQPMQPGYAGQEEMLPDAAFDGAGGDWGFGGVPEVPAMPEPQGWDFGQMLGFDPSQMMQGFDINQMMPDFDPNAMLGLIDPTAGW